MRLRAPVADPRHQDTRGRLDDEAVALYGIVIARNLVTSLAREEERRHQPRRVDPREPERPEDAAPAPRAAAREHRSSIQT
jgi:hypothetical protein